jgi:predicted dehydrogenase
MAAPDRLGVGVVGLGVGEQHACAYVETGRCDLRWLCDLDRGRAARLAERLGGRAAEDFEQILHDPRVQVVSIATYDDAHFAQVLAALEAGKHVFVEKPLCRTLAELRAIKQAWQRHGGRLKLASNLVLRAAPLYRWLKDALAEGRFGRLYCFGGEYLYGRLHKITHGWRKDVPDYSVLEGGGIHLIDLLLWMTGERPDSVFAAGNRICTQESAFRYPDFVTATLRFPSGLIGQITANFGCVHRHQHVVRLYGTEGTVFYDDAGPRLHLNRDPALAACPVNLAPLPASKGDLIASFVEAILENRALDADTHSFLDGVCVCVACEESLASESVVRVEYV